MSKTNILTKKLALFVLVGMFIVSMALGFSFYNPINVSAEVSYDNFTVTDGTVTYGEAKIQKFNEGFDPNTFEGYFGLTMNTDSLIVDLDSASSKFTFNKPVNIAENTAIAIAPIWDEEITNLVPYQTEFFITLTDAYDETNTVTIRQKLVNATYYALAGHSGMGGVLVGKSDNGQLLTTANGEVVYGSYCSPWTKSLLKGYAIYENGQIKVGHYENDTLEAYTPDQLVADLDDTFYVGDNTWEGFTGDEVYVSVTSKEGGKFAITAIGQYDLNKEQSLAYGGAGVEGEYESDVSNPPAEPEPEIPVPEVESYDYFNITSGIVKYDRADIYYGTNRPLTDSTELETLVVDFAEGATFSFAKPIAFTKDAVSSFITLAFVDKTAISSSDFNDMSFTVKVTNANDESDYVTMNVKEVYEDSFSITSDFSGNTQTIATGSKSLWGGMLKDYTFSNGKISAYHCIYTEGTGFARDYLEEVADLAGAGWEQFGDATQVYVSVTADQSCSLAISTIGEYDLTNVDSPAYDKMPIETPDSYDYFNVVDGTIAYDKVAIQAHQDFDANTLDGYMGATFNVNTLTVDLDSASSKFTFNKPINIAENTAIAIAPIWDEEITNLFPYQTEFFITLTDAYDATNTVTIRQKLVEGTYYALASHSGMDGVLVGCLYGTYVSTASGEVKYGTYISFGSLNLLKGYTINADGVVKVGHYSDTLEAYTPDMVIADLADSNYVGDLAWEGFTGDEVYVSVTSSNGGKFAITAIGEYDLTNVDSPAYDAMPTAEDICDGLLTMKAGADIRIDEEYSGIRFETIIDADKKDALDALLDAGKIDSYSFGTIIAPLDYLTDIADPTHATLTVDQYYDIVSSYETGTSFKGTLVKIKATNYDRKWIGRGYVKVTIDGVDTYYYADYNAENAKSVYDVAVSAYNNKEEAEYTPEQVEILKGYIDGVVVLDAEYAIVDKGVDYDEPYTVSVEGDVVTITANGVAIKSVVVNGNYVVAEVTADGSVATISKS